ncbi:MAG: hypothetical protein WCL08_06785 [Verrucomicrobiota bacterium]
MKLIKKPASTLSSVLACTLQIFLGTLILGNDSTAQAIPAEQQTEAALMPFLDVLASPPAGAARAFRLKGRVESIGSKHFQPEELPTFDIAVQPPHKMRISLPMGDTQLTACRNAQHAWVAPESALRPFLEGLPPSGSNKVFQPLELPFSGKQLALLPVLLEIQDKGTSPLDGSSCKVVDVRIQPAVARLMPPEAQGWAVRLWLNAAGTPVRAGVSMPAGSAVFRVDQMEFSAELPSALWTSADDAKTLSPGDFEQLATRLFKQGPQR